MSLDQNTINQMFKSCLGDKNGPVIYVIVTDFLEATPGCVHNNGAMFYSKS